MAMPALAPEQVPVVAPSKVDTALVSSLKCTYYHRDSHDMVECYTLQRHLYNGQVKAGTVLPANFKTKPPRQQQQQQQQQQTPQRQHPYKGNYNGKDGNQSRNNNKASRNGNHGRPQGRDKYHDRRNGDDHDNSDYGIVAFTTLDLSQGQKN
ncbi:Gag-pol Polyprotein [Phytophthora cinnamomi]|uniref:Gag-pol Polyprotein n=1 Tax=Phytophthora cinnamomi TaxID=4785 RepID=UPI0035595D64|nr:Gag-pol Polyprotein [Phytophthora cinnamomi]